MNFFHLSPGRGIKEPMPAALRLLLGLPLLAALLPAQQFEPLSFGERAEYHARKMVGPGAIAGSAFSAGMRQWTGEPQEWGGGMAGYGRR